MKKVCRMWVWNLEVEENFCSEGQTSLWCLFHNSSSLSQHFQEWFSILSALKWDWSLISLKGHDNFSNPDPSLWSSKIQNNEYQLSLFESPHFGWQLLPFGNAIGCEVSVKIVYTHNLLVFLHRVNWQEEVEEILQLVFFFAQHELIPCQENQWEISMHLRAWCPG